MVVDIKTCRGIILLLITVAGFMPVRLPASCLTMAPRLEKLEDASSARPPFLELQPGDICRGSTGSPTKDAAGKAASSKKEGINITGSSI